MDLKKNKKLPGNLEEYLDMNFKRIIEEVNIIIDNELGAQEQDEKLTELLGHDVNKN